MGMIWAEHRGASMPGLQAQPRGQQGQSSRPTQLALQAVGGGGGAGGWPRDYWWGVLVGVLASRGL